MLRSHRQGSDALTRLRLALAGALLLALLGIATPSARADGDPASDVLATQDTFIPRDAALAPAAQRQLEATVAAAAAGGYPIRVALIASPSDLGSVSALWQRPAAYARYLGEELSLLYHGAILVVMPGGVGFQARAGIVAASAAPAVGAPGGRAHLAVTAVEGVKRLVVASGRSLRFGSLRKPAARANPDPAQWIAFVVGLWLIGLSWWASLRARPLRLRQRAAGRLKAH